MLGQLTAWRQAGTAAAAGRQAGTAAAAGHQAGTAAAAGRQAGAAAAAGRQAGTATAAEEDCSSGGVAQRRRQSSISTNAAGSCCALQRNADFTDENLHFDIIFQLFSSPESQTSAKEARTPHTATQCRGHRNSARH